MTSLSVGVKPQDPFHLKRALLREAKLMP